MYWSGLCRGNFFALTYKNVAELRGSEQVRITKFYNIKVCLRNSTVCPRWQQSPKSYF